MPVKHQERSTDTAVAKKSKTKIIFNRYNKEKITLKGMESFFVALFYRIGYAAELETILAVKWIKGILHIVHKYGKKVLKEIRIFADRMFDTVFDEIGKPMSRIKASFFNIKDILKSSKQDKNIKAGQEIKAYVTQGVKKHKSLIPSLVSYAVPILCFVVMIVVVDVGMSKKYAVEISLDNEPIGIIENYNVLQNADKVIKNKLVTLNDEQKWSIEPEIRIINAGKKDIYDERQLADSILKASNEDIVSASGLYVDGTFYGAIKNPERLNTALKGMLAPYDTGEENKSVSFLEDVSVLDGVFFTDTVINEDELVNMVTSEVAGEKFYTTVEGDSPSLIAQKNGLRTKELYALNPNLEGGSLHIGDQILVSQAVPFLRVKEIVRESREVEVGYKTEQKPNDKMNIGSTKTTQKGEKGINLVTSDVEYIDGVYQNESIVSTEVIKEPVNEIIDVGRLMPTGGVLDVGGTGAFGWPTGGGVRVSRGFAGQYPAHNGVDIAGPYGTAIIAADSGVVTKAVYTSRGYGVYIIIDHGNGYQSLYGHCSSLLVSYGEKVSKGQVIGRMGSTGNSTGNHLHFEIKSGNTRYDPYRFW
ncbi:MAG: M23 family metallopeptidase [Oscillospiraceae bacterium]